MFEGKLLGLKFAERKSGPDTHFILSLSTLALAGHSGHNDLSSPTAFRAAAREEWAPDPTKEHLRDQPTSHLRI